ncbi:MAG: HIT family protein [Deltaproteobacteria bacterium]|nr:HIT family protein [Deltaproteobacteria bacterium]
MDCIFCRIIAGEIPAQRVFEDEHTLAFMDINPVSEGHLLVIPKTHVARLFDADPQLLTHTIHTVQRMAKALQTALGVRNLNLLQNNGKAAFQSVDHLHFHLIPRREGDGIGFGWRLVPGDQEVIRQAALRISGVLQQS